VPSSTVWCSPRAHGRSFCLRFRFLLFEQVREGLAPFQDRGRSGALRPTWPPRASGVREGNPGVQGAKAPGLGEKTGRSIRRRQEFARFTKPDPASSQASGRAPALHASEYLTTPALAYPFRFAHTRRVRPLLSGALTAPFTPHHYEIPGLCKLISLISIIWLTGKGGHRRYCAGGQGLPMERAAAKQRRRRTPSGRKSMVFPRSFFGLASSTALTLLVIPAITVWLRDDERSHKAAP
jgi:hypothetical protein